MAYSGRSGSRKPGGSSNNRGRSGSRDSKPAWKRGGEGSHGDGNERAGFKKKSFEKPTGERRRRSADGDDERPAFKKKSFEKPAGDRRRRSADSDDRPPYKKKSFDKPAGDRRRRSADSDDRPAFRKKSFGDKPFGDRRRRSDGGDDRPAFKKKSFGPKDSSRSDKPFGERRRRSDDGDERPAFSRRSPSDKKKSFGDKPSGERRSFRGKPGSEGSGFRKRSFGGDSKPSWKKGSRGEGDFAPKKSFRKREENDWETFDNKEDASSYVKKIAPNKSSHRGKSDSTENDGDGKIRLNKYIANTGLCSRREADEMIEAGVIKVNGKIVTELGTKIDPTDTVHYGDQPLKREKLVYILLNKPKDYITTTDDPQERKTVLDLVQGAGDERVYPVGRLDRNTTGVLLLTNDGDLAERLMHPKYGVEKIYQVSLDMNLRKEDFDKILAGIELEDGFIKADDMSFVGDGTDHKEVGIVLHSGRNRIVRRMFEQLGYTVKHLDRVGYAGLTKKNVPKGKWRFLEPREVGFLKMKVGGERQRQPKK